LYRLAPTAPVLIRQNQAMLSAALLLAATIKAMPTDDVWLYQHAQSQASDPYLRAWGGAGGPLEGSMSVLRFTPSAEMLGPGRVELVLHLDKGLEIGTADGKAEPLEVRLATGSISEADWSYEMASEVKVGAAVIGKGGPETDDFDEARPIRIRLDESEAFQKAWAALQPGQPILLALTTKMQPAGVEGGYYRVYSRNAASDELKPRLEASRQPSAPSALSGA
jgi:hypothetical protein